MKPPYWPAWLLSVPERRCRAKSKRAGRQCLRIASPGYRVCATHGSKSRGPLVTRWDCRPTASLQKAERARAQWQQRECVAPQSVAGSTPRSAHELGVEDIEQLMTSRLRS